MIPKFRGYLKKYDKVVDVREIDYRCNCIIWIDEHKYTEIEDFEDIELLQSTGLKDKSGVEIYEGDIIEEPYNSSPFRNSTLRSIEMYQGAWVARDIKEPVLGDIAITRSILRGSKVIGNIYENEDLLK